MHSPATCEVKHFKDFKIKVAYPTACYPIFANLFWNVNGKIDEWTASMSIIDSKGRSIIVSIRLFSHLTYILIKSQFILFSSLNYSFASLENLKGLINLHQ